MPIEKKHDVLEALMLGEDLIIKRIMRKNKDSWERAKSLASEFGFTPSSRAKMVMPTADDPENKDFA